MPHFKALEEEKYGNVYTKPATCKITPMPWSGLGRSRIGQILCDLTLENGDLVKEYPRYVARKQLQELDKMDLSLLSAYESEFTLCKEGKIMFKQVQDFSTLMLYEVEPFFLELEKALYQCGVDTECIHMEGGPGQIEFTFNPTTGIQSADDMFLFKIAAKAIAKKQGMQACFMSKVQESYLATSHLNHSLWEKDGKKNVFFDANKSNGLSQIGRYWIGGLMKHISAITAVCRPTTNCYRVQGLDLQANRRDWDFDNRQVSIRVRNHSDNGTYLENRIPSSAASFHLIMAVTVAAGIDGIKNKIEPPESGVNMAAPHLPYNLKEALAALEEDEVIVQSLGKKFVENFI